jgi:DHA1 family inner membrane transport protein
MPDATNARFPLFPLLVIAGAIFSSVTSEFLPSGLILDMADGLDVSEAQIGFLVTIFAGTVVLSTAPLTRVTRRVSRKRLMVALLAVFAVANFAVAAAPSYEVVVAARVLGGLAHGLFWAVTAPYAARLVSRQQLARALSVTASGGTAAVVLGVPVGTVLGQLVGWRTSFLIMGVVVLAFTLLVVLFLPPVEHIVPLATGEIAVPPLHDRTLPAVLIVCASVLLLTAGHNIFYTYLAPWITDVAGLAETTVGPLLFAFGLSSVVALLLAGILGDRFPRGFVLGCTAAIAVAILLLALGAAVPALVVAGVLLWGLGFGSIPSMMHTRNLQAASVQIRDMSAAWVTVVFNAGIGGGALIGGLIAQDRGYAMLAWINLAVLAVAAAFIALTDRRRMALSH